MRVTRLRFSIRVILAFTLAIALLLGAGIELNRRMNNYVLNPYRLQSMGDILIAYLEKHERWPANWDEVQRFVESNGNNLYGVRTFRELKENIVVDFSFDPAAIDVRNGQTEEGTHLRVVIATDGRIHGATHDPNTTILRYLAQKQGGRD